MGNPIIDMFKFIYNDLKLDYEFVRDVADGKREIKIDSEKLKELKDWRGILKENWPLFIIVVAAWCGGFFFAQVLLNNACTQAMTEWYLQNQLALLSCGVEDSVINTFNLTIG